MKQLYKLFPIIVSVGLFGCNNGTTQENTDSNISRGTASKGDFVSKLPDTAPTVKLSADANYAPYGFKDEYGNIIGFDIELMRYIGEDQGFKVEIYNDPWEEVFNNVDNKSRDMIAAGTSYSSERASKYLLSNAYAPLPTSIVYLDDTLNLKSLNDLSDLKMGVLSNSEPYEYFTQSNNRVGLIEQYPTTFAAVQAMAQGKVDVVADDAGVLRYTFNDLPSLQPKYLEYERLDAESARKVIIVSKDQPELLEKVNAGLENLKKSGTYSTLTTKWFGEDLTKDLLEQESMLQSVPAK